MMPWAQWSGTLSYFWKQNDPNSYFWTTDLFSDRVSDRVSDRRQMGVRSCLRYCVLVVTPHPDLFCVDHPGVLHRKRRLVLLQLCGLDLMGASHLGERAFSSSLFAFGLQMLLLISQHVFVFSRTCQDRARMIDKKIKIITLV